MDIGFIGLGRMGGNMVERLLRGGHRVAVYNRSHDKIKAAIAKGAEGAFSIEELVGKLKPPRTVWLMLPAGDVTQNMIDHLAAGFLAKGDLIVDGGNARYTDSQARAAALDAKGLGFVDAGTSGGIWGLQVGYCMMVGGSKEHVERLSPALTTLAPPDGWLHCGPAGAGHFVKMVHNGIEYGMMQAYAEGFDILKAAPFPLDLHKISKLWNKGSVVRSWLLELAESMFEKDPELAALGDHVDDSGEGRWTVDQAVATGVPAPVIALSLFMRFASQKDASFAGKVLAGLRKEFGGHAVRSAGQ